MITLLQKSKSPFFIEENNDNINLTKIKGVRSSTILMNNQELQKKL